MRYKFLLALAGITLLAVASCQSVWCDEFKEKSAGVILPIIPVTEQPEDDRVTPPSPAPIDDDPKLVSDINAGELYIIEHSAKLKVASSRDGHLSVIEKNGPLSLYARFADGINRNEYEERTYSSAFIYIVKAVKAGEAELLIFTDVEAPLIRQVLTVTVGPRPPPGPGPEPPGPEPQPVVKNIRISVITDADNIPVDIAVVLNALVAWNDLQNTGNEYRLYDIQTEEPAGVKAIEQLNGPAPGIVITDKVSGTVIHHGPIPATFDELKKLVKGLTGG